MPVCQCKAQVMEQVKAHQVDASHGYEELCIRGRLVFVMYRQTNHPQRMDRGMAVAREQDSSSHHGHMAKKCIFADPKGVRMSMAALDNLGYSCATDSQNSSSVFEANDVCMVRSLDSSSSASSSSDNRSFEEQLVNGCRIQS